MSTPCNHDFFTDLVAREREAGLCPLCLAAELVELRDRLARERVEPEAEVDPAARPAPRPVACGCGL